MVQEINPHAFIILCEADVYGEGFTPSFQPAHSKKLISPGA